MSAECGDQNPKAAHNTKDFPVGTFEKVFGLHSTQVAAARAHVQFAGKATPVDLEPLYS
jgi:hypothetical protein